MTRSDLDQERQRVVAALGDPCANLAELTNEIARLWHSPEDRLWICAGLCARATDPYLTATAARRMVAIQLAEALGLPDPAKVEAVVEGLILSVDVDAARDAGRLWPALLRRTADDLGGTSQPQPPASTPLQCDIAQIVYDSVAGDWNPSMQVRCDNLRRSPGAEWLRALAAAAPLNTVLRRFCAPGVGELPIPSLTELLRSIDRFARRHFLQVIDESTGETLRGTLTLDDEADLARWDFRIDVDSHRTLVVLLDDVRAGAISLAPLGRGSVSLEGGTGILQPLTSAGRTTVRAARAAATERSAPAQSPRGWSVEVRALPEAVLMRVEWRS